MKKNKKEYELMVIIKPMLPENVRMGVESRITEILEEEDGSVQKVDSWGKKHLAYNIDKHAEGYYIVYKFDSNPDKIISLDKKLGSNKEILRYLIVNLN